MASAFQSIQIHVWLMQKTKTILLLHAVSAARLDSYGCVQEKKRGEATCEEQARPNNDDEPSNHVGLCYDTVMEKHCWLSLHIMQVCVVTRRALNEEG